MYALGRAGLPATVVVEGVPFALAKVVKHDFWAGTGFYDRPADVADGPLPRRVVVKINRRVSLLGLPLSPIGRWLRDRERRAYVALADLPYIPPLLDGDAGATGLIHAYIEGAPLRRDAQIPDSFFDELLDAMETMRQRGFAYVDSNKPSNVLLGDDGRPYLFDFQISFNAARWRPRALGRGLLRQFHRSDVYHVLKLKRKFRPDLLSDVDRAILAKGRPGQRTHRAIAAPYFAVRRPLMRWLVRRGFVARELSA
jgi:hypothetical protein